MSGSSSITTPTSVTVSTRSTCSCVPARAATGVAESDALAVAILTAAGDDPQQCRTSVAAARQAAGAG